MSKCVPNQNTCDLYLNLLQEREKVNKCCLNDVNKIDSILIKKIDEEKLEGKLKIRYVLQEFIEVLNEKIEILMAIMQDLSREYVNKQLDYSRLEETLIIQKEALNKVEKENQILETTTNTQIHEIRNDFIGKWKELNATRKNFVDVEKELSDTLQKENSLKSKLISKKEEHKKLMCTLKSQRALLCPVKFTMEMFDKLRRKEEKYLKEYLDVTSCVECYKQNITKIQHELEVVRKIAKKKLNMVKLHDEWRMEQLECRREELEAMKEESSQQSDESDKLIDSLRSKICMMGKQVAEGQATVHKLQEMIESLSGKILSE